MARHKKLPGFLYSFEAPSGKLFSEHDKEAYEAAIDDGWADAPQTMLNRQDHEKLKKENSERKLEAERLERVRLREKDKETEKADKAAGKKEFNTLIATATEEIVRDLAKEDGIKYHWTKSIETLQRELGELENVNGTDGKGTN